MHNSACIFITYGTMSLTRRCLIRPRSIRTGLTVIVSFMLAYLLFQCAFLVLNSVSTESKPSPEIIKSSLWTEKKKPTLNVPSQSYRVPLGFYYSANDFALKPFVAQSMPLADKVHQDVPKPAVADKSNDKKEQKQAKQTVMKQNPPKSAKHCQRKSPYYDTSSSHSSMETLQLAMGRALTLLNTLSGNKGSGQKLTPATIVPHVCKVNQTQLLVVIQSDLRNASQRNRIRQSWATLDYFNFDASLSSSSGMDSVPSKIDYLFLVDFVYDVNVSAQQLDVFMLEIEREQDVLPIQLTPAKKRLLHGYLLASEFVLTRCQKHLQYVAFITDDLMPNIPLLGSFATAQHPVSGPWSKPEPMYCFVVEDERPVRPKKINKNKKKEQVVEQPGKVIVTQSEWPKPVYPTYCDMRIGGFLVSIQTLKLWSACAQVHRPFEKLPQIYLTGILTESAGVPMQRYWTTYGDPVPLLPSLGSGAGAGQHLFFTQTQYQPLWVWKSVLRSILSEALR